MAGRKQFAYRNGDYFVKRQKEKISSRRNTQKILKLENRTHFYQKICLLKYLKQIPFKW